MTIHSLGQHLKAAIQDGLKITQSELSIAKNAHMNP